MNSPKSSSKPIGVVIYTYNRVDDARINMEIIRNVWQRTPGLENTVIVHAFNGPEELWPEKYLEDDLLQLDNPGHYAGAMHLIDEGVMHIRKKYPEIEHVVVMASDTWCVMPQFIQAIVDNMRSRQMYLASCPWGSSENNNVFRTGVATDFFVVNIKWGTEHGLFPIRFVEFNQKFGELIAFISDLPLPERLFWVRFRQAISRAETMSSENLAPAIALSHFLQLREREPIHIAVNGQGQRAMYWPNIGLITHHDPEPKRKALAEWKIYLGEHGSRLMTATNLDYFNMGHTKNVYKKSGRAISYGQ